LESHAAYFIGGLNIINLTIHSRFDLAEGGHNKRPIVILKNVFHDFVSFMDGWFMDKVIVACNDFNKGSNILLEGDAPIQDYEKGIIAFDNKGDMKVPQW